jgi:hypothetical protein
LNRRDFEVWDVKTAQFIVVDGDYTIYVGAHSRDLGENIKCKIMSGKIGCGFQSFLKE